MTKPYEYPTSFGFRKVEEGERQGLVNEVFSHRRRALRPDERPDVGRPSPAVEGRDWSPC